MTYQELLAETAVKKQSAIKEINKALNSKAGFLVKAEIEKDPGSTAWIMLAKDFCEALAENFSEIYENADESERWEISNIYMAYEDSRPDLYYSLPYEAQLFEV